MRVQYICAALVLVLARGSPALADDFCTNLKTALAAARTDFIDIAGPEDDIIPGWHDAKLSLPFASDCHVETDKRAISYFCAWEKEQPAAVNARYNAMIRQTEQCLTGFEKKSDDSLTTWRNPAIGTVTVDARHVMKNTQTWSLMLTVKR